MDRRLVRLRDAGCHMILDTGLLILVEDPDISVNEIRDSFLIYYPVSNISPRRRHSKPEARHQHPETSYGDVRVDLPKQIDLVFRELFACFF